MEKDNELFDLVLGNDEQILKTYRPNKFRAFFTQILTWGFFLIWWGIVLACDIYGYVKHETSLGEFVGSLIWLGVIILFMLICLWLTGLWCKKTVYAVTNKRVLIRTGRIGVDYKSLDFSMLGAVTVNVTWVDKLLHKNTGIIAFGSMSSPLVSSGAAKFVFSYIKNPYEVYKEVKFLIDAYKAENK